MADEQKDDASYASASSGGSSPLKRGRRPPKPTKDRGRPKPTKREKPKFNPKGGRKAPACVEINQCVGCTRQFFTKSFLGDDAAVLARSSGEEPASPRHRAGVASMAWRTTRRFSTNAP